MSNPKLEWKKTEKAWYAPGTLPEEVDVPAFSYFVVDGQGDPNGPEFAANVELLYALSYGVRMAPKAGLSLPDYQEYTVYPLEGLWDLKQAPTVPGVFRKEDLVYRLMIRQPDFLDAGSAQTVREAVRAKKKLPGLERVAFESIADGRSVQVMHLGPFANEAATFRRMQDYCRKQSLARIGHRHREIYLSDPRKTEPEKLRTILRFPVRDHFACD